jgi:hypothetical protein
MLGSPHFELEITRAKKTSPGYKRNEQYKDNKSSQENG